MNASGLHYGRGEYEMPGGAADPVVEQQRLSTWLEQFLLTPNVELPRPPAAAMEILALSRKPNARIEDLAALLEREPMLAGKVLKLSNSAMYGASAPCTTLKQALVRMGLAQVRDVVMEAAMQMTVIHADGFNRTLESVRRHSSAVAWISRAVARHTPLEAENAFLLGLLHDVGLSMGLIGVSVYARQQRKPLHLGPESWLAVESIHERLGESVLKAWGLPPTVTLVAQHHHSLMLGGMPHPQVAVLLIAEQLAFDAGWGVAPVVETSHDSLPLVSAAESSTKSDSDRALEALRLTPRQFETIKAELKPVLETLDGQFAKK